MKRLILLLFVCMWSLLVSQFYDPIKINEDLNPVFYRGNNACKIIGDEVYMTFVEDSLAANLYFSHSENGINFSNTLIDFGVYLDKSTKPTIEILPDGKIIIFYIKKSGDVYYLYKAESINNGASFGPEIITTGIIAFSTFQDNGDIYICYEQGDMVNLSNFLYITNYEESENHDIIKFWGPDRLYGPVHSNEDIWIQHAGGGINSNRPIFYGLVTTAGQARFYPGGQNYKDAFPGTWQEVFRGGLLEEFDGVENITFAPDASELRANATQITGHDIVYAKIMGSSFQIMFGNIQDLGTQEFEVYSWYPSTHAEAMNVINQGGNWFEDADSIWTNQVTLYDTVWSNGGTFGTGTTSAFWVTDAELWIEGEVTNKMTWGCADTIRIVGDITYTHTPVGESPDGYSGIDPLTGLPVYNGPVNEIDFFGCVSEQKIIIQYKHRDPFEEIIKDDNCVDVFIYGAYAAIAEGDVAVYGNMASYYDGAITFQYQHGHGSTPSFESVSPYTGYDTLYTYVDFHKYIFPNDSLSSPEIEGFNLHGNEPAAGLPSCGFPYEDPGYMSSYPNNGPEYAVPYGTDYPWYNPVWPEPSTNIVWERGELHVYGTLAQRRRGYIHRSGIDPNNHSPDNEWDLENHLYDGTHPSSGYEKDYHYDTRFLYEQPPYFPNLNNSHYNPVLIISRSSDGGNNFEELSSETLPYYFGTDFYSIVAEGNIIAVVSQQNDQLKIKHSIDNGLSFDVFEFPLLNMKIIDAEIRDGLIYFLAYDLENTSNNVIYKFDPNSSLLTGNSTFPSITGMCDFGIASDDSKVYAYLQDHSPNDIEILFNYTEGNSYIYSQEYIWQSPFAMEFVENSKMFIDFNQQDSVYVTILNSLDNVEESGDLWLTKGKLPGLLDEDDPILIKPELTLSNYPNPFNPSTTIYFSLINEITDKSELVIYNLKGQKVKDLSPSLCHTEPVEVRGAYEFSITWNGTDDNSKPVSSGIYFYKLKSGNFEKTKKMLMMK